MGRHHRVPEPPASGGAALIAPDGTGGLPDPSLELVTSHWEKDVNARKQGRPRRRYYKLTPSGRQQLSEAETRFRAVDRLFAKRSTT